MAEWYKTKSGINYYDYRISDGASVESGDIITFHYRLSLDLALIETGPWIENSWETHLPIKLRLGIGELIRGLDDGIPGMKIAGGRILEIPPNSAFGNRGVPGVIPPNTTLIYDIYIVNIEQSL